MTQSKHISPDYVSQSNNTVVPQSIVPTPELVAEFELHHGTKNICKVCTNAEFRELIDTLLLRGAGGESISLFLLNKYNHSVSRTTLIRHKKFHMNNA